MLLVCISLALPSCSLIRSRAPEANYSGDVEPKCELSYGPPITDTLFAGAFLGATALVTVATVNSQVNPSSPNASAPNLAALVVGIVASGASTALFGASAGVGYSRRGSCSDAWALHREKLAEIQQADWESLQKQRALQEQERQAAAERARAQDERDRIENERLEEERRAERDRAQAELARRTAALNALEGFQSTKWGMSVASVRRLYPQARLSGARLTFKGETAGFPSQTTFFFVDDKLTDVVVSFERTTKVRSDDDLMVVLADALSTKYGPAEDGGAALGRDQIWEGQRTKILLADRIASKNLFDAVTLQYSSVHLADVHERLDEKRANDL